MDEDNFLQSLIEQTKAYISKKRLKKLVDGWVSPMEGKRSVMLSKVSNKDFAFAMYTDGKRDFEIGINILEDGYFDKAVYHFQQAVEKALKAVLICFGIFIKTHFVGEILIKDVENKCKNVIDIVEDFLGLWFS